MTTLSGTMKSMVAVGLAAMALLAATPADAHRGGRWRGDVDIRIGVPYWGWGYWGPRWYYAPPPMVYAPPPVYAPRSYEQPVYVERDDDDFRDDDRRDDDRRAAPQPPVWWYWCPSAKGYHPYVKDCPGGWQRVPPQPVPPQ